MRGAACFQWEARVLEQDGAGKLWKRSEKEREGSEKARHRGGQRQRPSEGGTLERDRGAPWSDGKESKSVGWERVYETRKKIENGFDADGKSARGLAIDKDARRRARERREKRAQGYRARRVARVYDALAHASSEGDRGRAVGEEKKRVERRQGVVQPCSYL